MFWFEDQVKNKQEGNRAPDYILKFGISINLQEKNRLDILKLHRE